jgi:hypothetical protein
MQILNNTSEDINFDIKSNISASKRSDRMTPDVVLTSAGAKGGFDFEFQGAMSGTDDKLLLAALYAEKWEGFGAGDSTSIVVTGGSVVAATGVIDLTAVAAVIAGDFFVGKTIYINTDTANKGFYTITELTSTEVFKVTPLPAADETFAAGVTIFGQTAKNGAYQRSFTFEKYFEDVSESFAYAGMSVDTLDLKIESEKILTGNFSFIGKDAVLGSAPIGSVYTDPPTTPIMSANFNVSNVKIDGVAVQACLIESMNMSIKNNVEGKPAVGTFGYCRASVGSFGLDGALNMYFNDATMYEKFLNNTAFSLSFMLTDGGRYTYVITMPKLKLSSDTVNSKAKNSDVMDDAKFAALAYATTNCMIQIDRFYFP